MIMVPRSTTLLRKILLAATLATGFGLLWFAIVLWLGTSILETWSGKSRSPYESLVVKEDGTILIQSVPLDNLSQVTHRDLEGRPVEGPERRDQAPALYLDGERKPGILWFAQPRWEQRIKLFMDEREPAALWYFVHDGQPDGSGYFVGFEQGSKRRIGFIGLAGLRSDAVPQDERIPVRGEQMLDQKMWSSVPLWISVRGRQPGRPEPWDVPPRLVHIPSGNRLRLVDLAARTVTIVFEAAEPILSVAVPTISSYSGSDSKREAPILVRTRTKIHKLDHQYKLSGTLTIPGEVDTHSTISWYETSDGRAIAEYSTSRQGRAARARNASTPKLLRIERDGAIRDALELSLRTVASGPTLQEQAVLLGLSVPSPAVLCLVDWFMAKDAERTQDDPSAFADMLKNAWPSTAAVLVLSAVLAIFTWGLAGKFGLSRREQAAWTGFVALLGLPGLLGFLLHRRWPVRTPCPHCRARTPRDRHACAVCGTPLPDPALTGIEIFA
jgi:hypothetical protein